MMLAQRTSAALTEFAAEMRTRFGDRLARLMLFGSYARGNATEDSDVDVLIVVRDLTADDGRFVDACVGDILTRSDVLLSPLLLSEARFEELHSLERRLVVEIDRDGRPL